jgi:hypothetical protein
MGAGAHPARARAIAVAHRHTLPCFGCCGGCEWQHIDYNAQVDFKTGIVREQLARIGGLVDAEVRSCVASPRDDGYRNRIQLIASANASCRNGGCIHTSWVSVIIKQRPYRPDHSEGSRPDNTWFLPRNRDASTFGLSMKV